MVYTSLITFRVIYNYLATIYEHVAGSVFAVLLKNSDTSTYLELSKVISEVVDLTQCIPKAHKVRIVVDAVTRCEF